MAIQSNETLVTKGDLKTLYTDKILPYLGGNMMMQTNVSDYRSTDEKCIGIWIDGKPLYQKIYSGTTPSSGGGILCTIPSLDTLVWAGGILIYTNGNSIVIPQHSTEIFKQGTTNNILFAGSAGTDGWYSRPCWITFQYTKTTDTTSSALTTPGCYDINRPDLWPNNKEIFFGNGLYGQKFKGTVSNTGVIQTTATGAKNIINCHFHVGGPDDSTQTPVTTGYWATNNFVSGVYLNPDTQFNGLVGSVYYSKKYEMWVTYTK